MQKLTVKNTRANMSSFAPSSKRARRESDMNWESGREFFAGVFYPHLVTLKVVITSLCVAAGIPRIQYRPDAPPQDVLCFRHYNADEVCVCVHECIPRVELVIVSAWHSPDVDVAIKGAAMKKMHNYYILSLDEIF